MRFLVALVVGFVASVLASVILTFLGVPTTTRGALSLATLVVVFWLINRRDLSTVSQETDEPMLPPL